MSKRTAEDGPPRRGQLASERARFELRGEDADGEGTPDVLPAGYGLTFVRAFVRDPRHVLATWDVNDPVAVHRADAAGWDRLSLRATDARNRVLVQILIGRRSGTHHLDVPPGRTLRLSIGLERSDGRFFTVARSAPVRMPPEGAAEAGPSETLRLSPRLDRRYLVRNTDPVRAGHRAPARLSPAWRLYHRVLIAAQAESAEQLPLELTGPDLATTAATGLEPASNHSVFYDEDRAPVEYGPSSPGPGRFTAGSASSRHWLDHWSSGTREPEP